MEIGIDSFASNAAFESKDYATGSMEAMQELLERMQFADEVGLDVFGIGQHFRREFLDSAQTLILAAAASRTNNIKLTSAVIVLSVADPVVAFQNFATLDLISEGRAEMVVGRGSFVDGFPLFGLDLANYDNVFAEKLELLLRIRDSEEITWIGQFRPPLRKQPIYPRPVQDPFPIWLGVGGTPSSFARAGMLGLKLMLAAIGGETDRFRGGVDLYRQSYEQAGHPADDLAVGLHSLGYVAETRQQALEESFPGYAQMFNKVGKERGWPPVTRDGFEFQAGPTGALLIGDPEEVAEKILRHSEALGGIDRLTFMMDNGGLSHEQHMKSIELIGKRVAPIVRKATKAS